MRNNRGVVLASALLTMVALLGLLSAYVKLTHNELAASRLSVDGTTGFYAAEAGLNLRAKEIRATFEGYNRPDGTSPGAADPCSDTNQGDGDFQCKTYDLRARQAVTYVIEDASNPVLITVPPGEAFQNLKAQEYRYDLNSVVEGPQELPEAIVTLRFKSRLVPLFQFAAFYNKDLEILPGPPMVLSGPVHSNGDLYLDTHNSLDIVGHVTAAGNLYRGRKDANTCSWDPVRIADPAGTQREIPPCGNRTHIPQSALSAWGDRILLGIEALAVPEPGVFDPEEGRIYWDNADLRVVLNVNAGNTIELRAKNQQVIVPDLPAMAGCDTVATTHQDMYNAREGSFIRMLDLDVQALLNCVHTNNLLEAGRALNDDTHGGLVWHVTVMGPSSGVPNNYGIRLRNSGKLQSTAPLAPLVKGFTVVSDQAIYLQGDFNKTDKIPAAIMADSLNVLSNAWNDANSWDAGTGTPTSVEARIASSTTVYAAFLAGTDTTGGIEGHMGQDLGQYNGGLENFPRFHEKWSGKTLTYRGSYVSLNQPRHVDGLWECCVNYVPPNRDWDFDVAFNDAKNLPPLTPRFVYTRQELFVRQFER